MALGIKDGCQVLDLLYVFVDLMLQEGRVVSRSKYDNTLARRRKGASMDDLLPEGKTAILSCSFGH